MKSEIYAVKLIKTVIEYEQPKNKKTWKSIITKQKYESPLHIISAQISELGLTLAQCSTEDKSNEIPTVQKLLKS